MMKFVDMKDSTETVKVGTKGTIKTSTAKAYIDYNFETKSLLSGIILHIVNQELASEDIDDLIGFLEYAKTRLQVKPPYRPPQPGDKLK